LERATLGDRPAGDYDKGMDARQAEHLARQLLDGQLSIGDFVGRLDTAATIDVGDARLDLDRRRRCGNAEVVFGQGKTVEALDKIFRALLAEGIDVLATRVSREQALELESRFPAGRYNNLARTFRISLAPAPLAPASTRGIPPSLASNPPTESETPTIDRGKIAILTAGTSDAPVAEEARETALWMGVDVTYIQDVGVAGPQRLRACLPDVADADAIVVVAGMEGALPSVVGGYVACPVVAVPTSVGYGASFGGLAALLGMLNSCAANVTVVNIDAGFKGGYIAGLIAQRVAAARGGKYPIPTPRVKYPNPNSQNPKNDQ
jgi:NCAIR mutase (PurE)-related protein